MAEKTYTVYVNAEQFGNGKSMFAIWNPTSSGRVIRIYRIGLLNSNITAVTGVMAVLSLTRITACSSGVALDFVKHDSTNPDMPGATGITAVTGGTVTATDVMRRIPWSTDEPAAGGTGVDEWQAFVPLNIIWDAGYGDSNVKPLTLRETQGIHLQCDTNTTAGYLDAWAELTIESS